MFNESPANVTTSSDRYAHCTVDTSSLTRARTISLTHSTASAVNGYATRAHPITTSGVARAGREESGWEERRERVRAMLERARVPVHVSAATGAERVPGATPLVVMGCARVAYPFTADAVECANEIVLARVRELVSTVQ